MDIEKKLNDLAHWSELVEYYSEDCKDDGKRWSEWTERRDKLQQEIVDYVTELQTTLSDLNERF